MHSNTGTSDKKHTHIISASRREREREREREKEKERKREREQREWGKRETGGGERTERCSDLAGVYTELTSRKAAEEEVVAR